jgi:hypothetical protein
MITVESVQTKIDKSAKFAGAAGEEQLRTGEIKAVNQSYWPWILLASAAAALGIWLWKGEQNGGEVSG